MADPTGMELTKGTKSRLEILEETQFGESGIQLQNLAQAKMWASEIVNSGLVPAGLKTEGAVLLAAQTGMELGFSPMRALQACTVINGNVSLKGEAALALIRNPAITDLCEVGTRGDSQEEWVGYARTRRVGDKKVYETTFSWAEAEMAGLTKPTKWKRDGSRGEREPDPDAPWIKYPKRMLMWRAVGFHMRDFFSDVGNGLVITQEAEDFRRQTRDVTPSVAREAPSTPDPLFANEPAQANTEPQGEIVDAEIVTDGGRTAESLDDRGGFETPTDGGAEVEPEASPPPAPVSHDVLDPDAEPPDDFESEGA